jgi:hypothetical protein
MTAYVLKYHIFNAVYIIIYGVARVLIVMDDFSKTMIPRYIHLSIPEHMAFVLYNTIHRFAVKGIIL